MEEQEFWVRLEYRVTAEFAGFADDRLRRIWCDGFLSEGHDLAGARPHISGRAWCGASGQEAWSFILLLRPGTEAYEQIDWSALLPDQQSTGWLSPDPEARTMTIDPLGGPSS